MKTSRDVIGSPRPTFLLRNVINSFRNNLLLRLQTFIEYWLAIFEEKEGFKMMLSPGIIPSASNVDTLVVGRAELSELFFLEVSVSESFQTQLCVQE